MLLNILIFNFLLVTASEKDCGIVKFIQPQILGGTQISRGEWPFIAALYYTDDAKFFCGGTLISNKHVLTAAHCVQQKSSALRLTPEDLVVLLGAYNIDSKIERGVQQKDVAEIYVHPDWKVYHERYDADIAIFVLSDNVVFTKYIRAVCSDRVYKTLLHKAFVHLFVNRHTLILFFLVGWGLAENTTKNRHESIPRHTFTTALNDSYCYTSDQFLAIFSSMRTFCGGGEGGSPNQGDSGGGFFVLSRSVWVQFGIISASIGNASGNVVPNSFSVYTNVKLFKNWIENIVRRSEVETTKQSINVTASADKDTTIENIVRSSEVETTEKLVSVTASADKDTTIENIVRRSDVETTEKLVSVTASADEDVTIENIVRRSEVETTEQSVNVTAAADKDTTIGNIVRRSEVETTEQSASATTSADKDTTIENIVQRFKDEPTGQSGSVAVSSDMKEKIKFYCNYEFTSSYTCSVWKSNATIKNLEVEAFTGTHLSGYTDQSVTQIWFWHGTLAYIPDGIGLVFQKLEKLLVGYDKTNLGLKLIKRSNFKNMKELTLIQLHESYIETVDVDLLWELPNLQYFELKYSQLKVLPEKLFEKNTDLRHVNANGNQIENLPKDLFKYNPLITEVYFKNNKLLSISIDFTLTAITIIDFHGNSCIDKALDDFPTLSELQQFVRNSC